MTINNKPDIHEQIICANIFIRKGDKYLMLRRSPLKKYAPNVIHPVGGKVDIGENPVQTAVREVKEEAGISVKNVRLEAVIQELTPIVDEPYNWLIFHFSADYDAGDVITTEEGSLEWLSADQIKDEQLFPSVRLLINEILDSKTGTMFATVEYDTTKQHIVKSTVDISAK